MLAKRIIPCLDVDKGRVVKGVKFVSLRDAGDPVEAAKAYNDAGADELVFLDITASHEQRPIILDVVARTAAAVFMPLTVGGGIRSLDDIRALLNAGADKVSINTSAIEQPAFISEAADRFGCQCIVVAIDAKAGQVVSRGWVSSSVLTPQALAQTMIQLGVHTLICTDVSRDGMMQGPNLQLLTDVLEVGAKHLIASGGISSLVDLQVLKPLEPRGVIGAIIGKALYEGKINLKEAIKLLSHQPSAFSSQEKPKLKADS